MKNLKIKSLLAAAALVCQSAFADVDTAGRTYFMLQNVHSSTKGLSRVDRLARMDKNDDALGATVSAWAAYQQALCTRSGNELALALLNGKDSTFKVYGGNTVTSANGDLALQKLFVPVAKAASSGAGNQNYQGADNATLALKVEHKRVSGGVDLCYNADKFYEGLWLGAGVSFAWERNKLTPTFGGSTTNASTGLTTLPSVALASLLSGAALPSEFQQNAALTSLKIGNGTIRSRAAVNDVCLVAGLRVVDNETAELNLAVVGLIPGGQKRNTDYLFDANPGERQYKLGLKGCALLKLVCEDDYKIDLHAGACWKYAFKKSGENYVPQVKGASQYQLASKGLGTALVPLANLLDDMTLELAGASEVDAYAALALEKGCFGGSVGYNLGWIQEKSLNPSSYPAEKIYLLQALDTGTIAAANPPAATTNGSSPVLSEADIVKTETSKLTHNISAEANWTFTSWDYPLIVGAGVGYTVARDRKNTPEYITVGVRGGVSF